MIKKKINKFFEVIRGLIIARQYKDIKNDLGNIGFWYFCAKLGTFDTAMANKKLGWYLATTGFANKAIPFLEKSLEIKFDYEVLIFYLQTLIFTSDDAYDSAYLYQAYRKWGKEVFEHPQYDSYTNELTTNRRLRIGYTCHFITNSTSSTLLLPLLRAHHRSKIEVFMYSDQNDSEKISPEIKEMVEHWRDTSNLSDTYFCELVRQDKIDILIELNGLVIKNRYKALSRRPAPIQVNFYNHAATSGISGIDYILLGEDYKIDHLQPYFSEKIFHKKGITLATPVSSHFKEVTPLPYLTNGYITFGSFGQSHKVSVESIELWCRILKQVPNSKFYLKTNNLNLRAYASVYRHHFRKYGISSNRLIFEGFSDYAALLASYAKVDIALDTLPYAAGTTTIEASISGVPVISHIGLCDKISGRIGYFNLHSIGHEELLATSKEEYVKKAVALALDTERLLHYRNTLRQDVINSRRADMELYINELEDAYQQMWINYLESYSALPENSQKTISLPIIHRTGFLLSDFSLINHYKNVWDLLPAGSFDIILHGEAIQLYENSIKTGSNIFSKWQCKITTTSELHNSNRKYQYVVSNHPVCTFQTPLIKTIGKFNIRFMYAAGKSKWNLASWNNLYDVILSYGPYHAEAFKKCSEAIILQIGYPRLDEFFTQKIKINQLCARYNCNPTKKTVVWLPTWKTLSSVGLFDEEIFSLTDKYNVVVKVHPLMYGSEPERVAALKKYPFTDFIFDNSDNQPLYQLADYMLFDYGGPPLAGIYTDKNMLLLNVPDANKNELTGDDSPDILIRKNIVNIDAGTGKIASLLADESIWEKQRGVRQTIRSIYFAPYYGFSSIVAANALLNLDNILR